MARPLPWRTCLSQSVDSRRVPERHHQRSTPQPRDRPVGRRLCRRAFRHGARPLAARRPPPSDCRAHAHSARRARAVDRAVRLPGSARHASVAGIQSRSTFPEPHESSSSFDHLHNSGCRALPVCPDCNSRKAGNGEWNEPGNDEGRTGNKTAAASPSAAARVRRASAPAARPRPCPGVPGCGRWIGSSPR